MYPNDLFLGLDLYDIFICIGIVVCILVFGKLADRTALDGKLQNLVLFDAVVSIVFGYGAAVLMQAVYNMAETGKFELASNTGATFYGGLVGGAAVFIAFYFIVGHFVFKDGYHARNFFGTANCAISSVVVAHAFGRIGCLMAGCCHGKATDAWYGIMMHGDLGYRKYVPVQLFESVFLFALFAYLVYRIYHRKSYCLPIYMVGYGVWRYLIEFLRGDSRGATFTSLLTPSQLTALIMIVGGVTLYFFERHFENKHARQIGLDAERIRNGGEKSPQAEESEQNKDETGEQRKGQE